MNFLKKNYLLIIILIIAGFFRLYNLASVPPGLYPDEAMNGNNALEAIYSQGLSQFKVFYPENNGREGLFINIQAILLKIFNTNEPWVLRSASAMFGIITVLGVYLLVLEYLQKTTRGKWIALISSFLVATSFWHINFSRIGFRAIMASAFMTWGLYFLIKVFNSIRNKSQQEENQVSKSSISLIIFSAIGGILYGLGMHSYIAYRATPLIIIIAFLIEYFYYKTNFKKLIGVFFIYVGLALIVFAPLGIYFLKNPADFMGRTSQLSVFASPSPIKDLSLNTFKTIQMFFVNGDYNWRHNLSGQPQIHPIVGIMFLIGLIYGLYKFFGKENNQLSKEEKNLWVISLVWLAVAFLPVVISNEGIPHALRSILMIVPVYIISAMGFYYLFEILSPKVNINTLKIFFILITIFLIITIYQQYFITWGKNQNTKDAFASSYVEIGHQIKTMSPLIKKYIVYSKDGALVRDLPMKLQTTMFITDSFRQESRERQNIYYINQDEEKNIDPTNSVIFYLDQKEIKQ